jgi:hypothetical protein
VATPLRNVRVPDDLWSAALVAADANGTTVSAVVIAALERYVARARRQQPRHVPTVDELTDDDLVRINDALAEQRSEPGFWQSAVSPLPPDPLS